MYRFVIHCGLKETVMGKPHPIALRSRVVAFVEEGMGIAHAARHFRVSPRFVNNLIKLKAETGSLEPRRQGRIGGASWRHMLTSFAATLKKRATRALDELCVELATRGVSVHRSNVGWLAAPSRAQP
jgi:transposase